MVYKVTTLNDDGEGSFRQGILSGENIIFDIKGTIILKSDLPIIDHRLHIISNQEVIVDCKDNMGLVLNNCASGSTVEFLNIINSKKDAIAITEASNCIIRFCHLLSNKMNGIYLKKAKLCTIFRNLLSRNQDNGLFCAYSDKNIIQNNYIGVEFSGTGVDSNLKNGMHFYKSNFNEIGGTEYGTNNPTGSKGTAPPTFTVPQQGNLVSGNKEYGILMEYSKMNIFYGNFIGTNFNGNKPLANEKDGVHLYKCEQISFRGCNPTQNPFVHYNVLSGNKKNGLHITDCSGILVQGNFFGIAANNGIVIPNDENGILIDGNTVGVLIGGEIPQGNVTAGNRMHGICITENAKHVVSFNTFGGLFAFGGAAPNRGDALFISSQNQDRDQLICARTCVMSGNRGNAISCVNTRNVVVDSVICGLSTNGTGYLPNEKNNIYVSNSNNILIISRARSVIFTSNIFGGSRGNGILITDKSYNVKVESAFIGVDIAGVTPFSNFRSGIVIEKGSHDNVVNTGDSGESTEIYEKVTALVNNIIGLNLTNQDIINDITGNIPTGKIKEKLEVIIENLPNVISGNDEFGIYLDSSTYNNAVINNYIGYGITKEPIPNYRAQIVNESNKNIVENNLIYIPPLL